MAQVTAFTAARSKQIEDTCIVTGTISGDDLILYQRDGTVINAGDVRGPQGIQGPAGDGTTDLNSVTTAMIQDGQITLAKMATNSIDSNQYVDGSIDRVHLAADLIDSTKIADNALRAEHYNDLSIQRAHLANDIIDGSKLADNAINSEHYANGSIDNEHLATNSVTSEKIAANSVGITELDSTGWTNLTLLSSFENVSGRQPAQYRMVGDEVEFRGTIKTKSGVTLSGASQGVLYIPSGFEPLLDDSFPGTGTSPAPGMYFYVDASIRLVYLYNFVDGGTVGAVSLTGIRYSRS